MSYVWEIDPYSEAGCIKRPYFIPYPKNWQGSFVHPLQKMTKEELDAHLGPMIAKLKKDKCLPKVKKNRQHVKIEI